MSFKLQSIILLLTLSFNAYTKSYAQEEIISDTIATSMEEALKSPLNFTVLDLSKQKLKELPNKFDQLVNLHSIYLNRNKLKELPSSLSSCSKLRILDISNNKFEKLPDVVCAFHQLRLLDLSNNIIEILPECLKQNIHLERILMVGNEISVIPSSFTSLDLIEIDMRMIQMNEGEQNAIRDLFPEAEIRFSKPCNCFEEKDEDSEDDF